MNDPVYIIGAGIIGLLAARELVHAGVSVVLLERQAVAREASWAGGGILSPLHPWRYPEAVNRLIHVSQALYPALADSLYRVTGIDPEWTLSGLLILDTEDRDLAAKWAEKHDKCLEFLRNGSIREVEPNLAEGLNAGLWMPSIAQIRSPRLTAALRQELVQVGVELREHTCATGLGLEAGRLKRLRSDTGDFPTARCLVAAGAWTGRLLAEVGLQLPVLPMRGQILLLQGRPDVLSRIIVRGQHYLIPRRDGRVLVGSTVEDVGFDRSTTNEAKHELHQAALELVPRLARYRIERHWAGLRPGSADGVPFIGEHPDVAGLYVCAGHFRNGLGMGPASAKLIVDLMLERAPEVDPAQYRLDRSEN